MSFKMLLSNKNSSIRTARQQHSQQYSGEFLPKNLSKTSKIYQQLQRSLKI